MLVLAAPAASQAAWSVLEPPSQTYASTPIVVDDAGTAYQLLPGGSYAVRPPGSVFTTAATPGSSIAGFAFDDTGASAWLGQATADTVGVTRRTPGAVGTFGTTVDLGTGSAGSIAVNPTGLELIAYGSTTPTDAANTPQGTLRVATREPAQATPALEVLPGDPIVVAYDGWTRRPLASAVLGQDGSAAIVYQTPAGAVHVIERDSTGTWSAARELAGAPDGHRSFTVASNARGDAVAVISDITFRTMGRSDGTIVVALRSHDATFRTPETLVISSNAPRLTSAAVSSDGVPHVAITTHDIYWNATTTATYRHDGVSWGAYGTEGLATITASRSGARMAMWRTRRQAATIAGLPDESRLHVRFGTSASWDAAESTPPQLASPASSIGGTIGLFGDGRAVAVWSGEENEIQSPQHRYAAVLDDCTADCMSDQARRGGAAAARPRISGISREPQGSVVAGWPITLTAAASDPDAQLPLTYQWSIDGGPYTAGGATITHTFAGPNRTADVRVIVTDQAGATSSSSTSIFIAEGPPPPTPDPPKPAGVIVTLSPSFFSLESTLDQPLATTIDTSIDGGGRMVVTATAGVRPQLYLVRGNAGSCADGPTATSITCTIHDATGYTRGVQVDGTAHADSITVRGTAASIRGYITGGGGNDAIDMSRLARQFTVDAGPGEDDIHACGCTPAADDGTDPKIEGGAGADVLSFERSTVGVPRVWGTRHHLSADIEVVRGSSRADWISAPGAEYVAAGAGNDTVIGAGVAGLILLGPGNDRFVNHPTVAAAHRVLGGRGSDTYAGTRGRASYMVCLDSRRGICPHFDGRKGEYDQVGSDVENLDMSAGWSDDFLVGSPGPNRLYGGGGKDGLLGGAGADVLHGGAGIDFVTYEIRVLDRRAVRLSRDGRRNDGVRGEDLIHRSTEILAGSMYSDVIVGSPRNDGLVGLAGNDRIVGGRGYDVLDGGPGNDLLDARDGRANDVVRCGPGRDVVRADRGDRVARDCEIRR